MLLFPTHGTYEIRGSQHSQHPRKHKKETETWKEVNQKITEDSGSKETEIELIFKTVRGKRKGNLFKRRN